MKRIVFVLAISLSGCGVVHEYQWNQAAAGCETHGGLSYVYGTVWKSTFEFMCNDGVAITVDGTPTK